MKCTTLNNAATLAMNFLPENVHWTSEELQGALSTLSCSDLRAFVRVVSARPRRMRRTDMVAFLVRRAERDRNLNEFAAFDAFLTGEHPVVCGLRAASHKQAEYYDSMYAKLECQTDLMPAFRTGSSQDCPMGAYQASAGQCCRRLPILIGTVEPTEVQAERAQTEFEVFSRGGVPTSAVVFKLELLSYLQAQTWATFARGLETVAPSMLGAQEPGWDCEETLRRDRGMAGKVAVFTGRSRTALKTVVRGTIKSILDMAGRDIWVHGSRRTLVSSGEIVSFLVVSRSDALRQLAGRVMDLLADITAEVLLRSGVLDKYMPGSSLVQHILEMASVQDFAGSEEMFATADLGAARIRMGPEDVAASVASAVPFVGPFLQSALHILGTLFQNAVGEALSRFQRTLLRGEDFQGFFLRLLRVVNVSAALARSPEVFRKYPAVASALRGALGRDHLVQAFPETFMDSATGSDRAQAQTPSASSSLSPPAVHMDYAAFVTPVHNLQGMSSPATFEDALPETSPK